MCNWNRYNLIDTESETILLPVDYHFAAVGRLEHLRQKTESNSRW